MSTYTSKAIHLKSRPVGLPEADNFELVEETITGPASGQVVVRNIYMSVDPYMRGRMIDRKSYAAPFQVGEAMTGGCVGQVVKSNDGPFAEGDFVVGMLGWREYYCSDGRGLRKIDPSLAPIQAFLGTFGMPGMTAYVGLSDIGQIKEGETVFVSAAAGAVGAVACQIARNKGCRVVGSAGSAEKIAWLLDEAGVDAAFNYKEVDDYVAELRQHCPDGLDVYFENVGGPQLEAALTVLNPYGRVVLCGMISQYNATEPVPGPRNLGLAVGKKLRLQGFIVSDHYDRMPDFYRDMAAWNSQGKMHWQETIVEGIENAPQAFIGLFSGQNVGKMVVKLAPDPTV